MGANVFMLVAVCQALASRAMAAAKDRNAKERIQFAKPIQAQVVCRGLIEGRN